MELLCRSSSGAAGISKNAKDQLAKSKLNARSGKAHVFTGQPNPPPEQLFVWLREAAGSWCERGPVRILLLSPLFPFDAATSTQPFPRYRRIGSGHILEF